MDPIGTIVTIDIGSLTSKEGQTTLCLEMDTPTGTQLGMTMYLHSSPTRYAPFRVERLTWYSAQNVLAVGVTSLTGQRLSPDDFDKSWQRVAELDLAQALYKRWLDLGPEAR